MNYTPPPAQLPDRPLTPTDDVTFVDGTGQRHPARILTVLAGGRVHLTYPDPSSLLQRVAENVPLREGDEYPAFEL